MTEETTPTPKRRRGRPRKTEQAPVETAAPVVEEQVAEEAPVEAPAEAPVTPPEAVEPEPVVEPAPPAPEPAKAAKGPFTPKPRKRPVNMTPQAPQRILKEHEAVAFKGKLINNEVVVLEEVLREVYPINSKRPIHYLVYPYGAKLANTSVVMKQAQLVKDGDN